MVTGSIFTDRSDAGRHLAQALMRFRDRDPVVLALPRGGVPVGREIARALEAPLDVVLVRKIGAPGHPEFGIGAVVDRPAPLVVRNEEIIARLQSPAEYVEAEAQRQLAEIARRRALYQGARAPVALAGRTVLLVDDGIATGGTARAALRALSSAGAQRLVLAVPVAPQGALDTLQGDADEIVCLMRPDPFRAVGFHYADFDQTTDNEVIDILRSADIGSGTG